MYTGFHFYEGLNKEHGHMQIVIKARSKRSADKILLDNYNKGWHTLIYYNFRELNTVEEAKLINIVDSLNNKEFNTKYIYLKQGD